MNKVTQSLNIETGKTRLTVCDNHWPDFTSVKLDADNQKEWITRLLYTWLLNLSLKVSFFSFCDRARSDFEPSVTNACEDSSMSIGLPVRSYSVNGYTNKHTSTYTTTYKTSYTCTYTSTCVVSPVMLPM